MSLQLGAQTLGGLKLAAELIELPTLVAAAVQTALTGASDAKPPVSVAAKSAFAALLTLLFEAARSDASPADVTNVLEECSWPSSGVSELSGLYAAQKEALRSGSAGGAPAVPVGATGAAAAAVPSLSSLSSTAFPSVVDVSWRVDDYLRSDAVDAVRVPTYMLSLTVLQPQSGNGAAPQTQQLTFSCSFQQLQDLLAKLKSASATIRQRVE